MAPSSRYIFHSFPIEETDADKAFMHVLEGIVMAVVTEGMGMIDEVRWRVTCLKGVVNDGVVMIDGLRHVCSRLYINFWWLWRGLFEGRLKPRTWGYLTRCVLYVYNRLYIDFLVGGGVVY